MVQSPQDLFDTLERLMQYAKKRCNEDWQTQSDLLMAKLKDALVCQTTTGSVTVTTTAPSCGENATMLGKTLIICRFTYKYFSADYACVCNEGFIGDATVGCEPDNCLKCSKSFAFCSNNKCYCKSGFIGDPYDECYLEDPCATCKGTF